ncbi:MAG: hypothetical protein J7K68_00480 [Candidatus Diapherotrites archaeon]|nr:hypothetical protein [Candidatus Diapherotrites archaeon]
MYTNLMKSSFSLWKKDKQLSFIPLIWVFLRGLLFLAVVVGVLLVSALAAAVFSPISKEFSLLIAILLIFIGIICGTLVFVYANAVYDSALYFMADKVMNKKKISIDKAIKESRPLWNRFFNFKLLQIALIILLLFGIGIITGIGILVDVLSNSNGVFTITFFIISIFLALLVGAYLMFTFFFSPAVILYGKDDTFTIFKKCIKLLHKKPAHVIISFIVIMLVGIVFRVVVNLILSPLWILHLILALAFFSPLGYIISLIEEVASAIFFVPWSALFILQAYKKA